MSLFRMKEDNVYRKNTEWLKEITVNLLKVHHFTKYICYKMHKYVVEFTVQILHTTF